MKRVYDLNTIDDLIEALGGPVKLGKSLDISQSAVSQWKVRGHISDGWHMRLFADATALGLSVNPVVFDLTEEQFAPLAVARSRPSARVAAG